MRILALDLGDRWVGSAIADPLGITCKPYQTVELSELTTFLKKTLSAENITKVIVGYPKTFSGTESAQTKKIVQLKQSLEAEFSKLDDRPIEWILWDERLSSKRASQAQSGRFDEQSKRQSHSIAAAFLLQTYLDHEALFKS